MSAPGSFALHGRTAFVSGASGHLGREMCFALGEAGAALILNGRNAGRLRAFAETLRNAGIAAECAEFDITDFAAVRDFFGRRGRLDILVNNAVAMTPKALADVGANDFDLTYRSTVVAAFEAVRSARSALLRAREKWGDASVVNIATMYGAVAPDPRIYASPGQMSPPHYGAAKAGLVQLTRHLAAELGPVGIRVNAVAPGPFPRPEVRDRDPAFAARLSGRTMLGRLGEAHEIRGPVLFLASPASSYITGTVVMADGGWTAW
jgi:NAD(P)-dependent dehydrogenase (short-subunit alcohol dehydrogenase family)